jgi:hypothetical protein
VTLVRRVFGTTTAALFAFAALAAAQSTPSAAPKQTIYVQDFEAHWGDSTGTSSGSSRRGPLSILKSARSSEQATMSAGSLSGAISDELKAQGMNSQRIAREATLPTSGWLVTGIFYALDTKTGMIQMPSFISGQPDPVNTQVTVSVADLAKNPHAPFIVFGTADALRGQGPPVGWNPYVVAAKFVVGKVESASDIKKLAKQIVDTIMQNKAVVEQQAKATQAPAP